jgi:hypothetical protein
MSSRRAAISDDGERIVLTLYEGRDGHSTELTPARAVDLARQLLAAALPKLERQNRRRTRGVEALESWPAGPSRRAGSSSGDRPAAAPSRGNDASAAAALPRPRGGRRRAPPRPPLTIA